MKNLRQHTSRNKVPPSSFCSGKFSRVTRLVNATLSLLDIEAEAGTTILTPIATRNDG
jgi:hypothetical protein